jgi:hypothetical protein
MSRGAGVRAAELVEELGVGASLKARIDGASAMSSGTSTPPLPVSVPGYGSCRGACGIHISVSAVWLRLPERVIAGHLYPSFSGVAHHSGRYTYISHTHPCSSISRPCV